LRQRGYFVAAKESRMSDDAPLPDPRDDQLYRRYVESCRQLCVEPVSGERARELLAEWRSATAAMH